MPGLWGHCQTCVTAWSNLTWDISLPQFPFLAALFWLQIHRHPMPHPGPSWPWHICWPLQVDPDPTCPSLCLGFSTCHCHHHVGLGLEAEGLPPVLCPSGAALLLLLLGSSDFEKVPVFFSWIVISGCPNLVGVLLFKENMSRGLHWHFSAENRRTMPIINQAKQRLGLILQVPVYQTLN